MSLDAKTLDFVLGCISIQNQLFSFTHTAIPDPTGGTMAKVERSIDPMDFSSIPRTRDFINSLPESERVCAEHGEAVVICLSDFVLSPGPSLPFGKAAFQACCESALNKALMAIPMQNRH
jgi:hypothetical protein